MESSGIGASLKEFVGVPAGPLKALVLGTLLVTGSPSNVTAQAAEAQGASSSPDLPQFTLREIVAGRNDTLTRIPGRWVHAALAAPPESRATMAYHDLATRSGVTPLAGEALASNRSQHVMGLYRRKELIGAARQTLAAIRSTLPGDSTRARFDHLFRPRGEWVVDLHDAALAWARGRAPQIGWATVRPALAAAGENTEEQHTIGYALVRALAAELPDPAAATRLLLRNATHPYNLGTERALRRAWRAYSGKPDRVFRVPASKILVPEVTFTIEDGFPEVIASRILIPPRGKGAR